MNALAVNLSFLIQPPSSVQAGTPFTVRVLAQGNGGTPLPEVTMTLSLVQISGSGNLTGTTIRVTGANGFETFANLAVSQPGTYALQVSSALTGYAAAGQQSLTFTVTP